jgi:hypothetical protein
MREITETPFYFERITYNPTNYERLIAMQPEQFVSVKRMWQEELRGEDCILGHSDADVKRVSVRTAIVGGVDDHHPYDRSQRLARLLPDAQFCEPPYSLEDWGQVLHARTNSALPFRSYSALPGLPALIDEFIGFDR